ncbi:CarD family transcriptional regulator [Pseudoramibacter porci]|uniref:CarD family transcriptional regulator n=1 Tax=Pseudoramibacter porci TaxID=2606631 RepID=A0A7X2NHG2_9FIRM|nr:CarD family transcriptional regulator [Pseudoramibacter porci]MSS20622.1 CarD family transcriptional regulator [Pseudoramibacter porci]
MYKVGDKIVYPMHGAGVIEDIEEMDIFDKKQTYYKVTIASEGMEILIPVDKADEVGLRDIPNHEDIKKMFEILKQPQDRMTSNWSKRYQDNMDQMKTGDLLDVARVTRNLMIMDRKKGLSSGDKKMLMTAKNFLISELMVVEHTEKEAAGNAIEDAVKA